MTRLLLSAGIGVLLAGSPATAQTPADVAGERAQFERWLVASEVSPLKAMAQLPVRDGIRLGPSDADVPLGDVAEHRIRKDGRSFVLETADGERRLGRNRPVELGRYTLTLADTELGTFLTVFGRDSQKPPPGYYPYDSSLVFVGTLLPPDKPATLRLLGPEGYVRKAREAGSIDIPVAGGTRLLVRRLPGVREEESELEIFFSDKTNGQGSYPAGRFVSLIPVRGDRYRVDFNRARNPFCAYSSAYACPIPWPGNSIPIDVTAGERYAGGGLEPPPPAGADE